MLRSSALIAKGRFLPIIKRPEKKSRDLLTFLKGIGEDFLPGNVHFEVIDDFVVVKDEESFQMTRRLVKEEGIYTGGSAGAAVVGAIKYAKKLEKPERILIVLHDSGNKYASKIYNDAWMKKMGYQVDDAQDKPTKRY